MSTIESRYCEACECRRENHGKHCGKVHPPCVCVPPAVPEPECPGPDCKACNGEACALCGAGSFNNAAPHCEHDVLERHRVTAFITQPAPQAEPDLSYAAFEAWRMGEPAKDRFHSNCATTPLASRVCERGVKGCVVQHVKHEQAFYGAEPAKPEPCPAISHERCAHQPEPTASQPQPPPLPHDSRCSVFYPQKCDCRLGPPQPAPEIPEEMVERGLKAEVFTHDIPRLTVFHVLKAAGVPELLAENERLRTERDEKSGWIQSWKERAERAEQERDLLGYLLRDIQTACGDCFCGRIKAALSLAPQTQEPKS